MREKRMLRHERLYIEDYQAGAKAWRDKLSPKTCPYCKHAGDHSLDHTRFHVWQAGYSDAVELELRHAVKEEEGE